LPHESKYYVILDQRTLQIQLKDETDLLFEKFGYQSTTVQTEGEIRAPIPGLVVEVKVQSGDKVLKGEGLVILEAMKMENEISSPLDGVVQEVLISRGQNLEKDTLMVKIQSEA
jgi:pyruvate carboxylase subunit B